MRIAFRRERTRRYQPRRFVILVDGVIFGRLREVDDVAFAGLYYWSIRGRNNSAFPCSLDDCKKQASEWLRSLKKKETK